MCDPKKSGIIDDPRMGYYTEVEKWSAKYAATIGMCGSYGHQYYPATAEEFVVWDNIVTKCGCRGRINGDLYRKWDSSDDSYDCEIAGAMNQSRWLEIKRCYKLCDNDLLPKRRDPGYDPAYKYDYAWKSLLNNVNTLSHSSDLDQCGDKTTAGNNLSPGASATGLCSTLSPGGLCHWSL